MKGTSTLDPRIEAYLSRLALPLANTLDRDHLTEIRDSAVFHIECLVDEFGDSEDPVGDALREFGEPDLTALGMLDEWSRGRSASGFTRCSSGSVWWSFVSFGGATAATAFIVVAATIWPGGSVAAPLALALVWGAPVIAGILTGFLVPTGNLRALSTALAPLIGFVWLLAGLMRPYEAGTAFAGIVTLGWMPLGAVSLSVTAWVRRNRPYRYRISPRNGVPS